ncbi:serine hydrolase domain-containing protein [Kribbella sp. CA-245084]|uniref:serine hydrolase domain-containing protein n=1 Tax=Kribbella sp. CA-245084 TaxID=3239940 RepID=UPI003D8EBB8D
MQDYLDSLVDNGAAGVLLHYRSGDQTWIGSSGRAELGTDRAVDPDGWFRIGSVTKTFTAVVVLQLAGEGKLQLDEPVSRWVPGMPDEISLRQLLNHTSGLYNYTDDLPDPAGIVRDRYLHHEPMDVLRSGLTKPRLFAPGSSWSYSNTNYIALGVLIEAVTGNAYRDEVAARILQPLGLQRTMVPDAEVDLPEPHASAYLTVDGEPVNLARVDASQAWAAGAVVSTAADLNRFYAALLSGGLLDEVGLEAMLTVVPTGKDYSYGLGIGRRLLPDGQAWWGHAGGFYGYLTLSYISEDLTRQLTLSYTGKGMEPPETGQVLAGLLT